MCTGAVCAQLMMRTMFVFINMGGGRGWGLWKTMKVAHEINVSCMRLVSQGAVIVCSFRTIKWNPNHPSGRCIPEDCYKTCDGILQEKHAGQRIFFSKSCLTHKKTFLVLNTVLVIVFQFPAQTKKRKSWLIFRICSNFLIS